MNYRFTNLMRRAWPCLCAAALGGLATACHDDYDLDDEGNYPSWLGGSIYEALSNPSSLESSGQNVLSGTFSNYVRLIDDLGYAETLAKTGSKTVFPANDEAFERFYQNNAWGVSSYEDLTAAMKRQLLYGSMLDNAILVEMLSNISDGSTSVLQGQALKHTTAANIIDTITYIRAREDMPQNNSYWDKFAQTGIHLVMDATRPMMVHFTEEQLTTNNVTTQGQNSDFEVITGTQYSAADRSAYIFRNKIINPDVTCKNGYIHQMQDVLLPPGNLAEVIRTNGESNLYSRMLERLSAPFPAMAVTNNYNDYATAQGLPTIDTIYQKRYFSLRSEGGELKTDPNGTDVPWTPLPPFDPGWNNYSSGATGENPAKDIAAMFVPTDDALWRFFQPGGEGEFLIEQFGKKENTLENLAENIDSIPMQNVLQMLSNLMMTSFVGSVPSKFDHVMDEASDPMGLSLDVINRNQDGTYDVKIANNGVAYMMNTMFAPPSLVAVSAPVTLNQDMQIMNRAIYDGQSSSPLALGLNYYAYLLAMSANYALFIPTDQAFQQYYIDPAYLNEDEPRVLKFTYQNRSPYVYCSAWHYDTATGEIGDSIGMVSAAQFKTQLTDILNYHTIVLKDGERLGSNGNQYYKTKHGGEIRFSPTQVLGGAQIEGKAEPAAITRTYEQKNGVAYAIDHVIQAPQQSVYSVLQDERYSEFMALCSDFDMDDLMEFASDKLSQVNPVTKKKRLEAYHPFAAKGGLTDNVNYFNTYNYTVFAPDNEAMQTAYSLGLPHWSDIKAIYDTYTEEEKEAKAYRQEDRDKALAMVEEINSFIRYHFQDNSIYADQVVEGGNYPTACSDTLGIREKLNVSGGNGQLTVTDRNGQHITVSAANAQKMSNVMTRDYVIANRQINTSSFAVVHQVSTPLCSHANTNRYDSMWTGSDARQKLARFRRLFDELLYKRYDQN
mgnify:CR=1 FL=1